MIEIKFPVSRKAKNSPIVSSYSKLIFTPLKQFTPFLVFTLWIKLPMQISEICSSRSINKSKTKV